MFLHGAAESGRGVLIGAAVPELPDTPPCPEAIRALGGREQSILDGGGTAPTCDL